MTDLQNTDVLPTPELLMSIVIDEETPQNAPLAAKYKKSFAYPSMKDRCPVILTKVVDLLYREKRDLLEAYGEDSHEEIKQAIGEISQLKNALQTGKLFECFTSSEPDSDIWNSHINQLTEKGVILNFYEADWLFAECYLYRKIREIFATKKHLNVFDPFLSSKKLLFNDSVPAIAPLVRYLEGKITLEKKQVFSQEECRKDLILLFKCALWANRLDLSLSGGTTTVEDDIFKIIAMQDENILTSDLDKALEILCTSSQTKKSIVYVMDNCGMEALCDLCLADYLVTHCGVTEVKFRIKPIPWFVSDVTDTDFHYMLDTFSNHIDSRLHKFGERWKNYIDSGVWNVTPDIFWCLGVSYSQMSDQDPDLYKTLSDVDLIIFKGDLNYRKLLQDVNWEPTTPFSVALGKFHPAPLVTLRTNKADLICGLKKGEAESLNEKHPKWMTSGDFAVIQYDSS